MDIRPQALREIANDLLERIFQGQTFQMREDLGTSVVRQWKTYKGRAGVFTISVHYWLTVERWNGQVRAGTEVLPGTLRDHLGKWGILERDLQRVLMDLTIAQTAEFINIDGLTVQIRTDPVDKTFHFGEIKDDPD